MTQESLATAIELFGAMTLGTMIAGAVLRLLHIKKLGFYDVVGTAAIGTALALIEGTTNPWTFVVGWSLGTFVYYTLWWIIKRKPRTNGYDKGTFAFNRARLVIRDGRVVKCNYTSISRAQSVHDRLQATHPRTPVTIEELEEALVAYAND